MIELKQTPKGGWLVVTKNGTIEADYVVNAGGLWAREVGRMAGVELPIVPMEHQYIVTNDIPAVAALEREVAMCIDFDGESYLRQEGKGLLIGTYEHGCKHWAVNGTPQDFAHELLPNDVDRIWSALEVAMERYPCLADGGIKRVINGGMVFAPDGNPIIGPVRGLSNYFLACGVMAGFSQGGGVGLAVAQWITEGEPGMDVFAMDVARFGAHANAAYVLEKTTENYRRRFTITCPNEELPAARPLKTTPAYGAFQNAGAAFGALYGWEYPQWFAGEGKEAKEAPTFRRSEAFARIGEEVEGRARGGRPVRILLLREVRRHGARRDSVPRSPEQQQAAAGGRQDGAGAAADAEGPGVRRPDGDAAGGRSLPDDRLAHRHRLLPALVRSPSRRRRRDDPRRDRGLDRLLADRPEGARCAGRTGQRRHLAQGVPVPVGAAHDASASRTRS